MNLHSSPISVGKVRKQARYDNCYHLRLCLPPPPPPLFNVGFPTKNNALRFTVVLGLLSVASNKTETGTSDVVPKATALFTCCGYSRIRCVCVFINSKRRKKVLVNVNSAYLNTTDNFKSNQKANPRTEVIFRASNLQACNK